MNDIKEKEMIIKLLNALFPGVKIYLFGSRARGTNLVASDIDLALDLGKKLSFLEIERARNVLATLYIPEKIDIVDMQAIPQNLHDIILKEGISWKL